MGTTVKQESIEKVGEAKQQGTKAEGVGTPKAMGFLGERPIDRLIKQSS